MSPPIELPTRIAGRPGHLGEEAVQQPLVGLHRRGARPAAGVPEPRQVEGHDAAASAPARGPPPPS